MSAATTVIAIVAAAATPLTSGEVDKAAPPTAGIVSAESLPAVPAGTPVRLMFTKEINSRTARNGDRFKLRVDEPVYIDGKPVIPVGTIAWGEIETVEKNGAVGKAGRLAAKLLYLELPSGRIPLRGSHADRGGGNGAGVVLAVVGFGVLGLLTGGDSARMKAGDTFTGYVDGPVGAPARSAAEPASIDPSE
jgi:hypothetical protein